MATARLLQNLQYQISNAPDTLNMNDYDITNVGTLHYTALDPPIDAGSGNLNNPSTSTFNCNGNDIILVNNEGFDYKNKAIEGTNSVSINPYSIIINQNGIDPTGVNPPISPVEPNITTLTRTEITLFDGTNTLAINSLGINGTVLDIASGVDINIRTNKDNAEINNSKVYLDNTGVSLYGYNYNLQTENNVKYDIAGNLTFTDGTQNINNLLGTTTSGNFTLNPALAGVITYADTTTQATAYKNLDVQTVSATTKPTATTAYLSSSATTDHNVNIDLNVALPVSSGYVLSSTENGVLSWVDKNDGAGTMFNPSIANLDMANFNITRVNTLTADDDNLLNIYTLDDGTIELTTNLNSTDEFGGASVAISKIGVRLISRDAEDTNESNILYNGDLTFTGGTQNINNPLGTTTSANFTLDENGIITYGNATTQDTAYKNLDVQTVSATTKPTATTAYLSSSATTDHNVNIDLNVPLCGTDGYVLSSTIEGILSWASVVATPANAFYVNDNVNMLEDVLPLMSVGDVVYISSGSFGSDNSLIINKTNIGIIAPNVHPPITEIIYTNVSIQGSQIRVSNLQFDSPVVITSANSRFDDCDFTNNLTITPSGYMTFNNCEFIGTGHTLTVSPNAGAVLFTNCNMDGITIVLQNPSPLQVFFNNCVGFSSYPANATYAGLNAKQDLTSNLTITSVKYNGNNTTQTIAYLNNDVQTVSATTKPTATSAYLTASATTNHIVNIDLNVGLPDVSGKVLSSTTAGALSWIEAGGGGGGNMYNPSIADLDMDSNDIINANNITGYQNLTLKGIYTFLYNTPQSENDPLTEVDITNTGFSVITSINSQGYNSKEIKFDTSGNFTFTGEGQNINNTIGTTSSKNFTLTANTLGEPNNIITFGDLSTQDTGYKNLDIQTLAGVEKTLGGTPFLTAVADVDDSHKWNIDLNVAYPDTTGKVLSSTDTGVLSWIEAGGGGGGGNFSTPSTVDLDMADHNILNATLIVKDDDVANITSFFFDIYTPTNSTLFGESGLSYTSDMFNGRPVIASGYPYEPDVSVPTGTLLTYFYGKDKGETINITPQGGNVYNINALQSTISNPASHYQFLVGATLQLTNTTMINYPVIFNVNFISLTEYGLFFTYDGVDTPTIDNLILYLPDTVSPPVPTDTTITSSTYTSPYLTITTNNNIGLQTPITQDDKVNISYNLTISYQVPNSSIEFNNQHLIFNAGGGYDMVLTKTALQIPNLSIEPLNITFPDETEQTTAFTNPLESNLDMNNNNITNVNTITATTATITTASITTCNTSLITPNIKNSLTELSTKSLFINSANVIDPYFTENTQFTFNYNGDKVYYLFPGEAKLYILDYSLPNPLTNFLTITNADLAGVYAVSNPVGNEAVGEFVYFLAYAEGSFHRLIKYYLLYGALQIVAELDPANAVWDRTNNLVATLEYGNQSSDSVFLYIGDLNKLTAPQTILITIYKILGSDGSITPQDINIANVPNAELILTSYIPFIDYANLLTVDATGVCLAIKATDNSASYIALYLWDTSVSQYFLYYYTLPKTNTPVNSLLQTYADTNTSTFATPTGICVAYGDNTVYTYDYMRVLPLAELQPDFIYINFSNIAGLTNILNLTAKTVANPAERYQKIGKFRSCYSYFTLLNYTGSISNVYFVNMNPLEIRRGWEFTGNTNNISILTYNNKNNCLFGIFTDSFINFFIDGSSGFTITDNLTITTSLNIASDYNASINNATTTKNCGIIALNGSNPGSATIFNPLITPYSIILITKQTFTHTNGAIAISSKEYGGFTITSTHNGDNDLVGYMICNS